MAQATPVGQPPMIKLNFVLRQKDEDRMILTMHKGFRLFFFTLALFLLLVLIMEEDPSGANTGPLILAGISFLCGSYYEAWIFDRAKKQIEQHFGLLFIFKRKKIPLAGCKSLRISGFVKGSKVGRIREERRRFFQTVFLKLSLLDENGIYHDIETLKGHHKDELERKAQAIAAFIDKPLTIDEIR
jgi:hypothetical protein